MMIKSLDLNTALLAIVLLVNAGSASARTGGTFVPTPGPAIQINAVASTLNPSQFLVIWSSPAYTGGDGGKQFGVGDGNKNGEGYGNIDGRNDNRSDNKYKKGDKGYKDHDPAPEPSTILSFGAALLIGGGVLYSRRLRRNRR